jgi:hypothetical protein
MSAQHVFPQEITIKKCQMMQDQGKAECPVVQDLWQDTQSRIAPFTFIFATGRTSS